MELLNKLLDELQHLKDAKDLLESIWSELGPYNQALTEKTRYKLQDFFKFDDSE